MNSKWMCSVNKQEWQDQIDGQQNQQRIWRLNMDCHILPHNHQKKKQKTTEKTKVKQKAEADIKAKNKEDKERDLSSEKEEFGEEDKDREVQETGRLGQGGIC